MSKQSLSDVKLDGVTRMKDILIGGYYNHYKNKLYQVLDIAKHSENLENLVIYKALYKNDLARTWARPEKMFLEKISVGESSSDNKSKIESKDRFELLPPEKWPFTDSVKFDFFHSHIYYTAETKSKAEGLHKLLIQKFSTAVRVSALYDELMGPHPFFMFEADFKAELFLKVIHFLSKNRDNLSILIHPLSGNSVLDHTDYAMFLGQKENLNLSIF